MRAAIVEAARRRFVDVGVAATTVEDVAEIAGVSRAGVYRYIGGRSDLVQAVLLDEAVRLFDAVTAHLASASDPVEVVGGGVRTALRVIRERPVLRRMVGDDIEALLPEITLRAGPVVRAAVALLQPSLLDAQDRGALPAGVDVEFVAEELIRYVLGLIHTPTMDGRKGDLEAAAARAERTFALAPLLLGSAPVDAIRV